VNIKKLGFAIVSCLSFSLVACSAHVELSPEQVDQLISKIPDPIQQDYSKKIADLDRVITLNPQDAKAYNNRGDVYTEMEKYPQAIADYTQAIKIKPQFAEAYHNRGILYKRQEKYPQAIADHTTQSSIYGGLYRSRN
jgi:tetratricopeptide (TPR) repeat protein